MEEYKHIHWKYRNYIKLIKLISFAICLIILFIDIIDTINYYNSSPFLVQTKLKEVSKIEVPTISICMAYQMNMTNFETKYPEIYVKMKKYNTSYVVYRDKLSDHLTIQQFLELASSFDEIGNCTVLLPNKTRVLCSTVKGINPTVSPDRLCFGFFERYFANESIFIYNREMLASQPWVSIVMNKTKMSKSWVDLVMNGLPQARSCYHGFPGFQSLSTRYIRHVKIGLQLQRIIKLKKPYPDDCDDYIKTDGCNSRESCVEFCYAQRSLQEFNSWPRNLQTLKGLTNFSEIYFSKPEMPISSLRVQCGKKFFKSDCLTINYLARLIDKELDNPLNNPSNLYELNIYPYLEKEHMLIYKPAFNDSQLYYEISQSISSFLGLCVFDAYKIIAYIYNMICIRQRL